MKLTGKLALCLASAFLLTSTAAWSQAPAPKNGKNYRIEKKLHDRALAGDLDFATCMDIVNSAPEPKTRKARK